MISELIREACQNLEKAKIDNPGRCVRRFLGYILNVSPEYIFAHPDLVISKDQEDLFHSFVRECINGKPISRILGVREFWGLPFLLSPDTLDPRPDSETLIEGVLRYYPDIHTENRILDLGTGSGCLLLSLLHVYKQSIGVGVDISPGALKTASDNAKNLGINEERVAFIEGSWTQNITGLYTIVVSNPPYISALDYEDLPLNVMHYDPERALRGGDDGLSCYRILSEEVQHILAPNGHIFLEIGAGQAEDVIDIFTGYTYHESIYDLAGHIRVLVFSKNNCLGE